MKDLSKEVREAVMTVLDRHVNWKPTCGFDSEEEKGFQLGLQAEAKLIHKEIKETLTRLSALRKEV